MRGFTEESPEVKARRNLQAAAKRFAAKSLISFNTDGESISLDGAAIAYVESLGLLKKRASRRSSHLATNDKKGDK